ncbi:MAG: sensor histidine kinase [Leptolyngbya sp. BL-A-14]
MSLSVFLAETFIMLLFLVLPKLPDLVEVVMDSTLLSLFIAPALYGLLYRPLVQEIAERSWIEQTLRQSQSHLKQQTEQLEDSLQKLQQTAQLVQTEKMSSLRQLVAGIAHEINNPINFIHGNIKHLDNYAQVLLELVQRYQHQYPEPPPEMASFMADHEITYLTEDLPNVLASIRTGTDRIRQMVVALRNFSRLDEAAVKAINLHEGIESTLLLLQLRLKAKPDVPAIQVIKDYGELPLVECYVGQLNQVFINLLNNAIDALEEAASHKRGNDALPFTPTIQIRTRLLHSGWIQISIQDNGLGVGDAIKSKIFDPLFTTKPVGKGTGLGLAICYQIVAENHKGRLTCMSAAGGGATFIIEIPRQLSSHQEGMDASQEQRLKNDRFAGLQRC